MKPKRRTISLVVTHNCNLSCSYCYEHDKSMQNMPVEIAAQAIKDTLQSSTNDYDECVIELFGGEPFLNFPLIKEICEYTWIHTWNKPYLFFLTTNGTLVHGEIQDWLAKNHQRFQISLSIDGTKEMHDKNRSGSFSQIDIPFYIKHWKDARVKMTVSPETIDDLAEGVVFLHSQGFIIDNNLAFDCDWSDYRKVAVFKQELDKLINYYLSNPEIVPCTLLNMKIQYCSSVPKKWCGVGTQMVAIDIDGAKYPCNMFLPLSLGVMDKTTLGKIDFTSLEGLTDPDCIGCPVLSICPTCYGSNFFTRKNVALRDKNICMFTKVRALANSSFQSKKILSKYKDGHEVDGDDYLIAKNAILIQDRFKTI